MSGLQRRRRWYQRSDDHDGDLDGDGGDDHDGDAGDGFDAGTDDRRPFILELGDRYARDDGGYVDRDHGPDHGRDDHG